VLDAKGSVPGSSGVVLECLVAASETEGRHLHWHLRPLQLWVFEELVRLREARPNIASKGLSME
jgi:hypothetical protein